MNFNYHEQEYEEFPNFKGGEKSLTPKCSTMRRTALSTEN